MGAILSELGQRARYDLNDLRVEKLVKELSEGRRDDADNAFNKILTQWCHLLEKPLVLLIDEIDALVGDSLISVLRQIRSGYN